MNIKKYKGVWFYGLSGSGKTIASKILKKKIDKSIVLDGDKIRKWISFDLGYKLSDRKIQIKRVFGIAKIAIDSKVFPIVSTVYMNEKLKSKLEKKNILLVNIIRDLKKIKNRKKIYSKKIKNVIGKDIKISKIKKVYTIKNNRDINYLRKNVEIIENE